MTRVSKEQKADCQTLATQNNMILACPVDSNFGEYRNNQNENDYLFDPNALMV